MLLAFCQKRNITNAYKVSVISSKLCARKKFSQVILIIIPKMFEILFIILSTYWDNLFVSGLMNVDNLNSMPSASEWKTLIRYFILQKKNSCSLNIVLSKIHAAFLIFIITKVQLNSHLFWLLSHPPVTTVTSLDCCNYTHYSTLW